jgi:DNA-binding beta-propeller fold protein YncE
VVRNRGNEGSKMTRSFGLRARLFLTGATLGCGWLVASSLPASPAAAAGAPGRTNLPCGTGYGFDSPTAAVAVAGRLFVASSGNNSVTELNAATGACVRRIGGAKYGFDDPTAIAADGAQLFIANGKGAGGKGSLTELRAATGSLVRRISGRKYGFARPTALVADGRYLFVVDAAGAVTEVKVADGALVRVFAGRSFRFDDPVAATMVGGDLWVANKAGKSLTLLDVAKRDLARVISGQAYALAGPAGIAFDGKHVWVSDSSDNTVTEIRAGNGSFVRIVQGAGYGFNTPTVWAVSRSLGLVYVASPPGASPMVTAIWSSNSAAKWYECNTNTPDPHFQNPSALVLAGGRLWVVNQAGNSLSAISPKSGRALARVP